MVPANAYSGSQHSTYGFAEINAPLVSPDQRVPGIRRLDLDFAFRYENYNSFGDSTTPKVGVIWSPISDVDVKFSWGESFKAPTLYQEHEPEYVYLYPASYLGVSTPGKSFLWTFGGNTDLKAERATTVNAGVVYHPAWAPGLRLEGNYFHIDYTNRILQPIANLSLALNANYAEFVTLNPSASLLQSEIDSVPASKFLNYGGAGFTPTAYNPANVIALAQNAFQNAAAQTYDGVDLSASYSTALAGGVLTAIGSASWLEGTQRTTPTSSPFAIVGTVYYPVHWRSREGLVWKRDGWLLAGYLNYIGGEIDNRTTPGVNISSQTTTDLVVGYKFSGGPKLLRDVQLTVSAINLFDVAPPYAAASSTSSAPFDATNYLTIGRTVSATISKHF